MAAPAAANVRVEGLRELNRALARSDRETRLGVRKELRQVADPIAADAETLARSEITRIGIPWSKMRVGQTSTVVYVAPRKRGVTSRGLTGRKRPKFAALLMDRAMQPALDKNADMVEERLAEALDRVADRFSKESL